MIFTTERKKLYIKPVFYFLSRLTFHNISLLIAFYNVIELFIHVHYETIVLTFDSY